ncbi:DUF4192 domain-containing protein [Nocardioides stalactiti]|uniref:DUF4192 domain-containing protein n=1 Tax=Nocardioides stalactiti TaxID=2755356 RepID=UPI00160044AB|nr:DUF4192 domain-containing protein [Nocardioides stalactiti]
MTHTHRATTRSTSDSALSLRARCSEDLIAAAPLVLGFHPAASVVMMTSDGARPFHARADLPARDSPVDLADLARALAADLVRSAVRNGARSMALVFFSGDERVVRWCWGALRGAARQAGLHVADAVRVDGQRYYPLLGDRHSREVGIAYDVSAHPFVVEAVLHGIVVEKDRSVLTASVAPDPVFQGKVERALTQVRAGTAGPPWADEERRYWGEWLRQAVARHVDAGTAPDEARVAWLCWLLQDERVRDAAWSLIDRQGASRHQSFWADVVRGAPDALVPAPAALLGWAAWQAGHGALAWIAVDRCREVDDRYPMATLLSRCLEGAVPPDILGSGFAWDEGLPA